MRKYYSKRKGQGGLAYISFMDYYSKELDLKYAAYCHEDAGSFRRKMEFHTHKLISLASVPYRGWATNQCERDRILDIS